MAEVKMTKRMRFEEIIKVLEASSDERAAEGVKFLNHEIELLDRKSSKQTMTKTQKENVEIMARIKEALASVDKPVTVSELMAVNEEMAKYSLPKLSALLTQLKKSSEVVRTEDKKKAYFSLAE